MPFDHLLLCDCHAADSIFGESGYSIRATSIVREDNTPDIEHLLLSEASKLFSYELPPAYGRSQPDPKTAPVRLSAIPIKEQNVVALMHSVYVPFDTRGRPNSYFTHVIFIPYDQFSWRDALKTWGKIQWEINLEDIPEDPAQADFFKSPHWLAYWPPHATQVLPKLDSLPHSGLDDFVLDPLFTPRKDETYFKNLLSHLCHFFKNPEKLAQPAGAEDEKDKNPALGYLLRREAPPQDGGELTGETIRVTGANPLHPNLGHNMEETFRHLLLAAYLFPLELTRPFGFSTYEPESHGEGIARGRVLTGLVKSADEPENDFLKDSLGYYPNPPGHETQNLDSQEPTGHYLADLPRGLLEAFTKSSIPIQQFTKEINNLLDGYKGKDWKTFETSLTLFWRINHAKQKRDYDSTVVLTKPPYWNNSHTKKCFEELKPKLLLPYANKCMEGLTQNPHDLEPLKILGNKEFFNWDDVCKCFCSKEFWQPFLKNAAIDQGKAFLVYSRFFTNLCSHLVQRIKDPLLNALYSLFTNGFLKESWKNNEAILEALVDLFSSQNKIELARVFFDSSKVTGRFGLWFKTIEEENTSQATREEMVMGLIQQALLPGMDNKWLTAKSGYRIFTGKQFSRALANLFQTKEQETIKGFFRLMNGSGNSAFFTATMKNLLGGPGISEKDSHLFKDFFHTGEYLQKEDFHEFLFNGESPAVIKFIFHLQRVSAWLKPHLESFLKELTWESFLMPSNLYFGFPFEGLFVGLKNTKGEPPDFSVLEDGLRLRESLKEFPDQFDKELFSQTRWTQGNENVSKKKIIEILWERLGRPPQDGFDKNKAERVMDLIWLQNPLKARRNIETISFDSLIPPSHFENGKLLITYSLLKHGLIKRVFNFPRREKIANLFRKNDTIIGIFLPVEADSLGLILFCFRWSFVSLFLFLATLNLFYSQNSIQANLANWFFIFICIFWGCESLFSKLNNLAPNEIGGQKVIASIWAIIGIGVGVLGFSYSSLSPPFSNITFATIEFFWLTIFAGMYKDGAERFLDLGMLENRSPEKMETKVEEKKE